MSYFQNNVKLNRRALIDYLKIWKFNESVLEKYLEAFDYFSIYPDEYNGSTASLDIFNIPGLDACAMIHDYMYIKFNCDCNLYSKIKSDFIYCNQIRNFNNGWINTWLIRFLGLFLSSPYFLIRGIIKNKKLNKSEFNKFTQSFS